jgi:hypothetical protein
MIEQARSENGKPQGEVKPLRVRLPGFIKDDDLGLGDAIKRVTYAFGMRACGGCEQRTATLNRWMAFTR